MPRLPSLPRRVLITPAHSHGHQSCPASTMSAYTSRKPIDGKNVLGGQLKLHSVSPITGYFRNGFCDVDSRDPGNHSVAAIVSDGFLNFSAERGNNLRAGGLSLESGCRWCLCVSRWKEAFDAFKAGKVSRDVVPRIVLEATNETALKEVELEDLKEFEVGESGIWEGEGKFWWTVEEGEKDDRKGVVKTDSGRVVERDRGRGNSGEALD